MLWALASLDTYDIFSCFRSCSGSDCCTCAGKAWRQHCYLRPGFPANQTLTIALESPQSSVDIGVAKTDSRGVFSTQIATPVEMEPGDYRLKVTGGENATEVDFRILAEAAASSSGPIQSF